MDEESLPNDFNRNQMTNTVNCNTEKLVDLEVEKDVKSENESNSLTKQNKFNADTPTIHQTDSSENIFLEVPITSDKNGTSLETTSDSDDSIIFCSDLENGYQCDKPKDLLTEISDILLSLSDDKRFLECINYSNRNGFIFDKTLEKRRSSVDIIFTYNVLNILYCKLKELKTYFELTQTENKRLIKENNIAEAEHVAYQIEVESLQKTIEEQKQEICRLQQTVKDDRERFEKEKQNENENFQAKLKCMRKKYENSVQEKDNAVMKYVNNESELIHVRKDKSNLAKRLKIVENERDDLVKKFKTLTSEKTSSLQTLELKKNELSAVLKEIDKLKEELSCKDIKSKWVEENLQKELTRYKEQNSLLSGKIIELEDIVKNYKSNLSCSCENLHSNEEKHITDINGSCNENETDSGKFSDSDQPLHKLENTYPEEYSLLCSKIQELQTEKLDYERNISDLMQKKDEQNHQITCLQIQLVEMESLCATLKEMEEKISSYREEIADLKEINVELRQEMESCREKEADLLNFTEKLSAKNVTLQSEYAILEAKKMSLEADRIPIENHIKELEGIVASLSADLEKEIAHRADDVKRLTNFVEEQKKEIDSLNSRLQEQQAENQSLKFKYSSTIRELTKEIQHYRKFKQLEVDECNSGSESICLESRTSSYNSLNEQQVPKMEPDRQTLIERIVKLQKINAKHLEKMEFLEEHVAQLLTEVKKKNRVIQHYVIREQSGALSSKMLDQHKKIFGIQAEMSKYGGIMASLYNPKCDDNSITLELSLEINRKLQAVLEDTILKNITLKENVETLGKEIEKLTTKSKSNET